MPPDLDRRSTAGPQEGARPARIDPLVLVVAVVSVIVYTAHGFHGALTRDLGVYSYAGQQVADGVPPYLGILNRAGPLAHAIPGLGALLARLGGFDDLLTMRVLFMLIATAAVCATYVLGRDLFGSRAAGLVSAGGMLAFHGFIQYASNGPREKTPMTLFVVLALWAVTRRRWFAAGVCTSLATLCLQTAFFSTFAAVAVGVLLVADTGRVRALVRVALGGLVPVAVLGAWFALAGSLREAVDAFYVINRDYTVPDPVADDLDQVWLGLQEAYGVTVWLLVGGAAALGAGDPRRRRAARTPRVPGARGAPGDDGRTARRAVVDHEGVRLLGRPLPAPALRRPRAGRGRRGRRTPSRLRARSGRSPPARPAACVALALVYSFHP